MRLSNFRIPAAIVALSLLAESLAVPGFARLPYSTYDVGPGCASFNNTSWEQTGWWGEDQGHGYCHDTHWTYANGNIPDSTMTWTLETTPGKLVGVSAYVPDVYSNVPNAHYKVYVDSLTPCLDTRVDQEHTTNAFVYMGECLVGSSGIIRVVLSDDGSPHDLHHYIGGDVVRFTVPDGV